MPLISEAPVLWKSLNGILCVYKPQGMQCRAVRKTLIGNLAIDINEFDCQSGMNVALAESDNDIKIETNLKDNPLVVGPRYLPNDIKCSWVSHVGKRTSGILVFGINKGTWQAKILREARLARAYHIGGRLGIATDTYDIYGAVVERSSYRHVRSDIIDRVLSSIQAAHQKSNFSHMGVHMQSQAAYELASKGTVRPPDGKMPFVYSIRCIDFHPPDFTIEVKCINEHESYLKTLIHDVGMKIHSAATCTTIRCIRYGPFSLEHALLRRHWHLQQIFHNLSLCQKILFDNRTLICDTPSSLKDNQSNKLFECGNSVM